MRSIGWSSLARVLGWIMAAAFVSAAVLSLLLGLQVFGAPPEPSGEFLDDILADFRWQQTQWPLEFAGTALFTVGFLALGGLGPVLGRLAAATDARRGLVTAAFLAAGIIGALSQLVWLGAKPVATSPQYCECGLLAEEIMSRLMALSIVGGMQSWLISGALLAAAIGLVTAGALGYEAGMPGTWRWLALVAAVLALVGVVLPILEVFPFDLVLVVVIAGILVPIWGAWLAARAPELWPSPPHEEVDRAPPDRPDPMH